MEKRDSKELKILKIIMFTLPFMFGLFYEYTAYIAGAILCVYLIYLAANRKSIKVSINYSSISIIIVAISYLITTFYAVDRGMAFAGALKVFPIIIFALIIMQLEKVQLTEVFKTIPYSGVAMVLICIIASLIPSFKESLYMADRLGGFFQYSNTFALFLLIGIIIIGYEKDIKLKEQGILLVLLVGILMTGSRSVFIVTAISLAIIFIRNKALRKFIISISLVLVIFSIIFVTITGNYQNLGRYLTISSESSTLIGRILYYKDGIKLFLNNPFGLGYMGYYYMEPEIQTGFYSIKFVHNDFLQIALDAGIIPLIAILTSIIGSVFSKNTCKMKRHILIVISALSLFDFNLQFLIIFLILLMTLDYGQAPLKTKFIRKRKSLKKVYGILAVLFAIYLYFSVAFFAQYKDNDKIAVELYSGNTISRTKLLLKADSKEKALVLADEILKQNKMSYLAYDAKALAAAMDGNFEDMVKFKMKTLKIAKYSINEYEDYIKLLKRAITYYEKTKDEVSREKYVDYVKEVPSILKNLEEKTDELAYKVKDKPEFQLSQESKNYIILLGGEL